MQQRHITWAKYAAGVAFFAGADTALGTGAVQALAELCLTSPVDEMAMPGMPMDHSGHAMPWLIAGGAFASFAGFGSWAAARAAQRSAWAPSRLPILAGLAQVALAQGRVSAVVLADIWNAELSPGITETDATIALARFATVSEANRKSLMGGLTDPRDRAAFITMSLRLLRRHGDAAGKGLARLETLAADSGMSGLEIIEHWDAAEGPSSAAIAVGEARALGAIAANTALSRAWQIVKPLKAPASAALRAAWTIARRAGHGALITFIRVLSSPRPARGSDQQLTALRRRFRRRGLAHRLPNLALPQRMTIRRELT